MLYYELFPNFKIVGAIKLLIADDIIMTHDKWQKCVVIFGT